MHYANADYTEIAILAYWPNNIMRITEYAHCQLNMRFATTTKTKQNKTKQKYYTMKNEME